ncbi:MAG: PilZ domain-containing protein [Mariprofundaceae bacterium]|nr:PilZ domain-containing protein [Mariprofundaceae bacterium]
MDNRRQFIRHPIDVPIQISPQSDSVLDYISIVDIGEGGIAFYTNVIFEKGCALSIKIPHVQPPFEALCVVCWQREKGDEFEVGVRFIDEDSRFRARMVEQVCHIEDYRKKKQEEGYDLTSKEAANEWIEKYAAGFPKF